MYKHESRKHLLVAWVAKKLIITFVDELLAKIVEEHSHGVLVYLCALPHLPISGTSAEDAQHPKQLHSAPEWSVYAMNRQDSSPSA